MGSRESGKQPQKASCELKLQEPRLADPFAAVEQDRIENGELRWQTLGLVDGFLLASSSPYSPVLKKMALRLFV